VKLLLSVVSIVKGKHKKLQKMKKRGTALEFTGSYVVVLLRTILNCCLGVRGFCTKQPARKLQLVSLVDYLIEEGKEKQALCQTTPKKNTPCTPAEPLERAAHEREGQQTMTNLHSLLSWHITENRNSIRIERARPRKTKQQSRPHFTTGWPIFANCAMYSITFENTRPGQKNSSSPFSVRIGRSATGTSSLFGRQSPGLMFLL